MRDKLVKTMIIVVGLLVICGTVGFGVFSYYYAQGNMSMSTDTSYTAAFNPVVSFNGGSESFISNIDSNVTLDCEDEVNVGDPVTCTGYLTVLNDGTNKIHVELYDETLTPQSESISNIVLTSSDFTVDQESFDLDPNESDTFNFTVTYQLDYDRENRVTLTSSESINTYYSMTARVKVKATEIYQ